MTTREKPFQAGDPEQVRKRERKYDDQRAQEIDELRYLLKQPEFRRFIWRHINATCGLLRSPFSPNGNTQTLNIGMQDVGRQLWAELEEAAAKSIPLLMAEYTEAQKKA